MPLTEEQAVTKLRRLEAEWPATLWVFAADGALHIMRCSPDGRRRMLPTGSVDADAEVTKINIPADGGDW